MIENPAQGFQLKGVGQAGLIPMFYNNGGYSLSVLGRPQSRALAKKVESTFVSIPFHHLRGFIILCLQ
jgi:hypothetical protein